MGTVLIRDSSNGWIAPESVTYLNEAELDALIAAHPELLPGVSAGALVCRQFPTSSGPIDLLIVNADTGALTIVECKLARNPEVRRKVFGQIVDYAASLRQQPFTEFHSRWIGAGGSNLASVMTDEGALADKVSESLAQARFTLVLAVDGINEPLKQMVLYLNEKTEDSTRIALIELGRHKYGDLELLTPETFGYESPKPELDAEQSRPRWLRSDFEEWLAANEPASLPIFLQLIEELDAAGFSWAGTRAQSPSGCINVRTQSRFRYPLLFHTFGPATIEIRFQDFRNEPFVAELLDLFNGTTLFDQESVLRASFASKPKIRMAACSDPAVRNTLRRVCQLVADRAN